MKIKKRKRKEKAPTLRLKALNKHSVAHIVYIEMQMLSKEREKKGGGAGGREKNPQKNTKNNNEKKTKKTHTHIM